jgi:hypothetical protein
MVAARIPKGTVFHFETPHTRSGAKPRRSGNANSRIESESSVVCCLMEFEALKRGKKEHLASSLNGAEARRLEDDPTRTIAIFERDVLLYVVINDDTTHWNIPVIDKNWHGCQTRYCNSVASDRAAFGVISVRPRSK